MTRLACRIFPSALAPSSAPALAEAPDATDAPTSILYEIERIAVRVALNPRAITHGGAGNSSMTLGRFTASGRGDSVRLHATF